MVASAIHGDETVVCIHDDYCQRIEAAEITQILLKLEILFPMPTTAPSEHRKTLKFSIIAPNKQGYGRALSHLCEITKCCVK